MSLKVFFSCIVAEHLTFVWRYADSRLNVVSGYSFKVPDFPSTAADSEGFQKLVDEVLSLLKSHLENAGILLENQGLLAEEVFDFDYSPLFLIAC